VTSQATGFFKWNDNMGFITLGTETATGIEPETRKTSVGVRVYLAGFLFGVIVTIELVWSVIALMVLVLAR
jgi:hypothetical protein